MKITSFAITTASLLLAAPSVASTTTPMKMNVDFELSQDDERPLTEEEQSFVASTVVEAYHQILDLMDTRATTDDESIANVTVVGQEFIPASRRGLSTENVMHHGSLEHDDTTSSPVTSDDLFEIELSYDCFTNCRKLLLKEYSASTSRRSLQQDNDSGRNLSASSPIQVVLEETVCSLLRNSAFDIFSSVHNCEVFFPGLDNMLSVRHFQAEIILEVDGSSTPDQVTDFESFSDIIARTYNGQGFGGSDYVSEVTLLNATWVAPSDGAGRLRRRKLSNGDAAPLVVLKFDIPTTMWKEQDCMDGENSASITCIAGWSAFISSISSSSFGSSSTTTTTTTPTDIFDGGHRRNLGDWIFQHQASWVDPEVKKRLYYQCVNARDAWIRNREAYCETLYLVDYLDWKYCFVEILIDAPRCDHIL